MMLKVELLSKEMMIKPSLSSTPPHLKTLKLSFLDQISPPVFISLIFFFQVEDDHGRTTSQLLKQSLSNVLSLFYPLAGRLKGNTSIDCNDAGALCVEARVNGFLRDVIENPLMEQLKKFLPFEPYGHHDDELILAVQINHFIDGGLAVGVCMSHKIGDGISLINFVNAWAVTARGGDAARVSPPNFGLMPSLFPPLPADLPGAGFSPDVGMTREKIVTRRLVFNKEKLADLKKSAAVAAGSSGVGNPVEPTRVEALSAYFWKHFIEASAKKTPIVVATHAVNLRARMNPPLPDATFGNLWRPAIAVASPEPTQDLVFQLRTSIRKINAEYAKALENGKEYLEHLRKASGMFCNREAEFCSFSSWCRFPIYEVDFGWGRPVWACTTTLPYKNVTIFMSTKCGDGIEAWVNMAEDDTWELN